MAQNKTHKKTSKILKKQGKEAFLRLPFDIELFQKLFDYLDEKLQKTPCNHDFKLTTEFLNSNGIDFRKHIDFFIENGGGCDCEILMNVEEAFPENQELATTPKPAKREVLKQLKLPDFEIESIPSAWNLYKAGENYEFQFGKNKDIKVTLIPYIDISDWENKYFWQKEWESITGLKIKSESELIYDKTNDFEMVTFKTKDWTPALTWIKPAKKKSWSLIFRTELSRLRGDMNELKNLLKKITS